MYNLNDVCSVAEQKYKIEPDKLKSVSEELLKRNMLEINDELKIALEEDLNEYKETNINRFTVETDICYLYYTKNISEPRVLYNIVFYLLENNKEIQTNIKEIVNNINLLELEEAKEFDILTALNQEKRAKVFFDKVEIINKLKKLMPVNIQDSTYNTSEARTEYRKKTIMFYMNYTYKHIKNPPRLVQVPQEVIELQHYKTDRRGYRVNTDVNIAFKHDSLYYKSTSDVDKNEIYQNRKRIGKNKTELYTYCLTGQFEIHGKLTPLSKAVYLAIWDYYSLSGYDYKKTIFTLDDLIKRIAPNDIKRVTDNMRMLVSSEVDKLRTTLLYRTIEYNELDPKTKKNKKSFIHGDTLLNIESFTTTEDRQIIKEGNIVERQTVYRLHKIPFNVRDCPYIHFDRKLLNTSIRFSEQNNNIYYYLIDRIIQQGQCVKRGNNILEMRLDTFYKESEIGLDSNKTKKKRGREILEKILSDFKKNGLIKGYKFYQKNKSIYKINIELNPVHFTPQKQLKK